MATRERSSSRHSKTQALTLLEVSLGILKRDTKTMQFIESEFEIKTALGVGMTLQIRLPHYQDETTHEC